ncbi:hypothetical protein BDEG_28292 [Batrachochytrium dendrobatidis JEL423]|uniref:Uncharacterized protein n=1 Tax=Batrachochytrium dendrobatidis (strain JEL423) TaxID=403673 RepID=A0A177X038_BATDL|nr:hypothetical protein BDEG_28292 [Batrachochytrium dendrobatidis JEL423]
MKLVDILLVLTAAATANAILPPADKDGSPKASRTLSQVSGPTSEPDPKILEEDWQSLMDEINSRIVKENWQNIFDPIDPSTFNQDQQQPIYIASPSTPKRSRKRPIDQPSSSISKYDQQQSINQPGPSASKQSRKQSTDEPGPSIPDKNWQRLIDEINSDAFEDWKELFDIAGLNTPNQNQQHTMDQSNPSTSGQNQQHSMNAIDLSIFDESWQQSMDQSSPNTPKRGRKRPIDQPNSSTFRQDQQQPMGQGKSANTSPNQATGLKERYQRTFDRIKKRLEFSKVIRNKKRKEYYESMGLKFKQWSALSIGKSIHGSKYNPDTEKKLKQEYVAARIKVASVRYDLKAFTKKHGLKYEEPESDSDSD